MLAYFEGIVCLRVGAVPGDPGMLHRFALRALELAPGVARLLGRVRVPKTSRRHVVPAVSQLRLQLLEAYLD